MHCTFQTRASRPHLFLESGGYQLISLAPGFTTVQSALNLTLWGRLTFQRSKRAELLSSLKNGQNLINTVALAPAKTTAMNDMTKEKTIGGMTFNEMVTTVSRRIAFEDRFWGRVAIIKGGANGIGRSTAEEFCREGGCSVIVDRDEQAGASFLADAKLENWKAYFISTDIRDETQLRGLPQRVVDEHGRVDYVINNAFSFIAKGIDANLEDWNLTFQAGPIAYAILGAAAAVLMASTGGGSIVNVSSISAFMAQPARWTYNAAKGAVHTLTKCMALDLAPFDVRVNSVSPGWIWTREVLRAAGGDREHFDPIWGRYHILGRCGDPIEVAAAILFLISDDASFITGSDLPVDGGHRALGSEGNGKTSQFAGSL